MALNIKIIDPEKDERWDEFLFMHDDSDVHQHSLWKKVIQETYQYEPFYIILEDENKNMKAGIPFFLIKSFFTGRRMVSLPFSDFSDLLIRDGNDLGILLQYIFKKASELKVTYIEIRTRKSYRFFPTDQFKKKSYFKNHVLHLDRQAKELMKKFHENCQRNIKKALKSDLVVVEGKTEKDMEAFYHLHALTRRKHGLPPQPYSFFKNMWRLLYPRNVLKLLLAKEDNRAIAAIVLFTYKDTMYYKYGASDSRFLAHRPNHLLLWKAIERSCEEGLKYFDFGRTAPEDKGLVDFKLQWGSEEYDLPYFYYPEIKGATSIDRSNMKYKIVNKVSQLLPLSILRIGGRIIYRHLG